jgi:predicted lipoprotein with Yx(FWY)xxD motif
MKRTLVTASCAAVTLLATLLTGCSGSSSSSASGSSTSAAAAGDGASTAATTPAAAVASSNPVQATVATKSAGKLGTILVDGKGRTLYLFVADTKKNQSTCTGGCLVAWPPLLSISTAKGGTGADANLIGTVQRSGGAKQVSYNGHPLYYYIGDQKPGQTNGQGVNQFGNLWYVVNAKGKQVTS